VCSSDLQAAELVGVADDDAIAALLLIGLVRADCDDSHAGV